MLASGHLLHRRMLIRPMPRADSAAPPARGFHIDKFQLQDFSSI
jgi:hypothetical protein